MKWHRNINWAIFPWTIWLFSSSSSEAIDIIIKKLKFRRTIHQTCCFFFFYFLSFFFLVSWPSQMLWLEPKKANANRCKAALNHSNSNARRKQFNHETITFSSMKTVVGGDFFELAMGFWEQSCADGRNSENEMEKWQRVWRRSQEPWRGEGRLTNRARASYISRML